MIRAIIGKRGNEATNFMLYLIPMILLVVIAAAVFTYMISTLNVEVTYEPSNLHDNIVMKRFYMSPDCLAYEDPYTGRVYPGVIDAYKFKQDVFLFVDDYIII